MDIDVSTLLLGSGFALFLVLLAWGNQIREPKKEIKEVEDEYRKQFDLKKSDIKPLIKESYETISKSGNYSFLDQTKAMIKLMTNKQLKGKDYEILTTFKELYLIRNKIEHYYEIKFYFSIIFTCELLLTGFLSIYNGEITAFIFENNPTSYNYIYMCVAIIFILIILGIIIGTYISEKGFIKLIVNVEEEIEG